MVLLKRLQDTVIEIPDELKSPPLFRLMHETSLEVVAGGTHGPQLILSVLPEIDLHDHSLCGIEDAGVAGGGGVIGRVEDAVRAEADWELTALVDEPEPLALHPCLVGKCSNEKMD